MGGTRPRGVVLSAADAIIYFLITTAFVALFLAAVLLVVLILDAISEERRVG